MRLAMHSGPGTCERTAMPMTWRTTAACLLLAPALAAAAPVAGVREVGEDGNRYYRVTCANGAWASVVIASEPREVCIRAEHLGRNCRTDWTVESAAAYACQTAPGRRDD